MTDQDKQNINNVYLQFKNIHIPEMESEPAKDLATKLTDCITIILNGIKEDVK